MTLQLWTPRDLYRLLTDERFDRFPSHFLDTYFTATHFSQEKQIKIAELPAADRRMAPFVLPTEQGKPIFRHQGESVQFLEPAYIKPKDAVRAVDARNPRVSELLREAPMTLAERFNLRVAEVLAYQIRTIKMRENWMAARAFIDGKVTVKYERDQGTAFPEVTVDFGRAVGHTVVKDSAYWSSTSTLAMDDIQAWADTMNNAVRGGYPARIYLGSAVVPHFRKNEQVRAELDTQRRGTAVDISTGLITSPGTASPLVYLGTLGNGVEVWGYKDVVENANGTLVDLLDPKEVLLVAPGAEGVRAYGAIYDVDALGAGQALATDIFSKMFKTDDPGELFIMSQSAPLPIPLYPNRTFKAKVLA